MSIKNTIEEFYKEWSNLGYRIYITIKNPPSYISSGVLAIGVKQCEYFIIEPEDGVEYFYTKVMFSGKRIEVSLPVDDIVNMFCREDINNQPGDLVDIIFLDPIEFMEYQTSMLNQESLVIEEDVINNTPVKIKHNLKLVVSNKLEDIKPCKREIVRNFHIV